jgi:hypothetical protein
MGLKKKSSLETLNFWNIHWYVFEENYRMATGSVTVFVISETDTVSPNNTGFPLLQDNHYLENTFQELAVWWDFRFSRRRIWR